MLLIIVGQLWNVVVEEERKMDEWELNSLVVMGPFTSHSRIPCLPCRSGGDREITL